MKNKINNLIINNNKKLSWINDGLIYLVKHGSVAYGTNIKDSDEDFRGIAIPPTDLFLSLNKQFEQVELSEPDTVIYDIRKAIKLAMNANPNIIEILFVDKSDIIYCSSLMENFLENRNLFISKKIRHTMVGYAYSQLKRIKTHRSYLFDKPINQPKRSDFGLKDNIIPTEQISALNHLINEEIKNINIESISGLNDSQRLELQSLMYDSFKKLKISKEDVFQSACKAINLDSNVIELMKKEREYSSAKQKYNAYCDWKNSRNKKRAEIEEKFGYDTKHAYHLIRLMRMCKEALLSGKINVKRSDFEDLLDIRNGKWKFDQLLEEADRINSDIDDIYKKSTLPESPDELKIENLTIQLIKDHNILISKA